MKLKLIALLGVMLWSTAALATEGSWVNVTVKSITTYPPYNGGGAQGYAVVLLSANSNGSASCVTSGYANQVVIDLSSVAGGFYAQQVANAESQGIAINLVGDGACDSIAGKSIEVIGTLTE